MHEEEIATERTGVRKPDLLLHISQTYIVAVTRASLEQQVSEVKMRLKGLSQRCHAYATIDSTDCERGVIGRDRRPDETGKEDYCTGDENRPSAELDCQRRLKEPARWISKLEMCRCLQFTWPHCRMRVSSSC